MTAVSNHFYMTLFRNFSHKIYLDNTLSAFKVKLAQPLDLNSVENLEEVISEISCPQPIVGTGMHLIAVGNTYVFVYFNVIKPQFVGKHMVRCFRTSIFPSTNCDNILDKFYYVPVVQRKLLEI